MLSRIIKIFIAVFTVSAFFACTLPNAIEARAKLGIGLSVDPETGDFSDILLDSIKENLAGEDENIKILQWKKGGDKDPQTFILQYKVLNEYQLDFLDALDFSFGEDDFDEIYNEIDISGISNLGGSEPVGAEININGIIGNIVDTFNDSIAAQQPERVGIVAGQTASISSFPPFKFTGFAAVTFGQGKLSVTLSIEPGDDHPSHPFGTIPDKTTAGANITFSDIQLLNDAGQLIAAGRDSAYDDSITLTGITPSKTVIFDLDDDTITQNFSVKIGTISDASTNLKALWLSVEPEGISDLLIRGVSGFDIDDDVTLDYSETFTINIDNITFYHALVGAGSIGFDVIANKDKTPGQTWVSGINFGPKVVIKQEQNPINTAKYGTSFGTHWYGLSDVTNSVGDPSAPLIVESGNDSLAGKHINTKDIIITDETVVEMKSETGGASFWLSDSDMAGKNMTISFRPHIDITEFEEIHVNALDIAELPEITPISLEDASEYIESIYFNEIGVEIKFGAVDIPGLKMMVKVPDVINDGVSPVFKDVVADESITFSEFDKPIVLKGPGAIRELEVVVEAMLDGVKFGEDKIMTIKNVDTSSKSTLNIDILGVEFISDWSEANVALGETIEGFYPEEGDDPIDLASLEDIIEGFSFEGIEAYLYMNGSKRFFSIEFGHGNGLVMEVSYTNKNGVKVTESLLPDDFEMKESALLNLDPDGDDMFPGSSLPQGGSRIINFDKILEELPTDLKFRYKVDENVVVTSEILNKDKDLIPGTENNPQYVDYLNTDIVLVVPLKLTAGPGAKIKIPDNPLVEQDDILDRDSKDDMDFIDDVIVNSLTLKVELMEEIFNGGTLYIRRANETPENALLKFELTGKNLTIPITGKMFEEIKKYPFKVEEMGIMFKEGDKITVPNKMGAVKVSIDADIQYTYKF